MLLAGLALVSSLLLSSEADARSKFTDRYDSLIESAVSRWWPRHADPLWWKAQLFQESRLDPSAVSPVGAAGLAQFMPGTWAEVSRELGLGQISPHMVKPAINAGAYYMRKLAKGWSAPRPETDRWDLARASYNAGFGNILKAQKTCGNPNGYADIMFCLHMVTGHHSRETHTYVARIHRWYKEMKLCRHC